MYVIIPQRVYILSTWKGGTFHYNYIIIKYSYFKQITKTTVLVLKNIKLIIT